MGADIEKDVNTDVEKEDTSSDVEKIEIDKAEYDKLLATKDELKASSTEAQKLSAFAEVYKDNSKFYKYYDADKAKAAYIAEQYGFANADDLKKHLDDYYKEHPEEKTGYTEDELFSKLEAKQEEKEAKKTLNSSMKELGISKDSKLGKTLMSEFDDLMDGKAMTVENVEKYFTKAMNIVKSTGDFVEELTKAKSALKGTGLTGGTIRKADLEAAKETSKLSEYKKRQTGSIHQHVLGDKK